MTSTIPGATQNLFLPDYGGPDDRLALDFVVQICDTNPHVIETVVRITRRDKDARLPSASSTGVPDLPIISSEVPGDFPDTMYGVPTTQMRLRSEIADKTAWVKYAPSEPGTPLAPAGTIDTVSVADTDESSSRK